MVVAQRTANVSKTVLTQCNSVIAFQQFDKTSTDFLTNYMGSEMAAALPSRTFRSRCGREGIPFTGAYDSSRFQRSWSQTQIRRPKRPESLPRTGIRLINRVLNIRPSLFLSTETGQPGSRASGV